MNLTTSAILPPVSSSQRKSGSSQLETEKSTLISLIQSGSPRVVFTTCTAGRAPVWTIFRKVVLDNQITPFVVCQICGRLLKYTARDGTKSMKMHMAKCCKNETAERPLEACQGRNSGLSSGMVDSIMSSSSSAFPSLSPPTLGESQFSGWNDAGDMMVDLSPSMGVTALTPALSNESTNSSMPLPHPLTPSSQVQGHTLTAAGLETVAHALHSALVVFDGDIQDVETEISDLEGKLNSLTAKRNELVRKKEVLRRAALAVCNQAGATTAPTVAPTTVPTITGTSGFQFPTLETPSNNTPSEDSVENPYDIIPKKSRRKQSSCDVRHFNGSLTAKSSENEDSVDVEY